MSARLSFDHDSPIGFDSTSTETVLVSFRACPILFGKKSNKIEHFVFREIEAPRLN